MTPGDIKPWPTPWIERDVSRWQDGAVTKAHDCIARETPVLMSYNGDNHAVMLATPQDLEDFAVGFSLSEGVIGKAADIEKIEMIDHPEGIEVKMTISDELFRKRPGQIPGQERLMTGRTGCGLCGVRTLDQAVRYPGKVGTGASVSSVVLHAALASLLDAQEINQKTGSTHAAAWAGTDGKIRALREDVGRHNALDKLVGFLARNDIDPAGGFAVVTSRASYEMVQKAASYGIGFLAAVSAPTSLAVRMADMAGLTLIGFARPHSHVVYTHPHRLYEEGKLAS